MVASLIKGALLGVAASGIAMTGVAQQTLESYRYGLGQMTPPPSAAAMAGAVAEWRRLKASETLPFFDYANFLLAHPGWPAENAMRRSAERALSTGGWSPAMAVSFFRRFPPLSSAGRVRFAEALRATGQVQAAGEAARAAWVAGNMAATDESALLVAFSSWLRPEDHDARMDTLLWQGATGAARRQIALTSPARQLEFDARLAFRAGSPDAQAKAALVSPSVAETPGFLADKATWLRNNAAGASARTLLARPHAFAQRPGDVEEWYEILLTAAKGAAADGQHSLAFDIARQVDDAYPAGTDVAERPYGERDDYTSLVWLAGQTALMKLGRASDAIGLFDRYGRASRMPQTRSKGLYWAGRAAETAGRRIEAEGFYARAAGFRDQFYGQLAAERAGQALVAPSQMAARPVPDPARTAFFTRETVRAAQYLGSVGAWDDQTAFVRQIALDAKSDADHVLAIELARALDRPDLGVMVGRSALQNGLSEYSATGFPSVRVPAAHQDSWTMIHAIARQESQFDRAAVSHAGARGLMQLMPGTAREVAGRLGLSYDSSALTTNPDYNIQLGSSYFQRLYGIYGSYPLAVAAYNAGGGNVNKWLRAYGDPRTGAVDMVDWIEAIPFFETKNYVQRVLENAVVYDLLNPARARSRGPANLSWYLGKQRPG